MGRTISGKAEPGTLVRLVRGFSDRFSSRLNTSWQVLPGFTLLASTDSRDATPKVNGYEVLAQLRCNPATETIPFIFLTALADQANLRQGMELGADDYITKPCTPTELLSAIATQLKKHAAYMQQYVAERDKARGLQQRVKELQRLSNNNEDLLQRISQELRDPLSNITMAIQMLKIAPSEAAREHYLQILHQECAREISLINQLSNLKPTFRTSKSSISQLH